MREPITVGGHLQIRPLTRAGPVISKARLDNDLCQAVVAGNTIYLRGQVPQDLDTGESVHTGNPTAQAEQVMTNVETLLAEADASVEHVVTCTIYLTDIRRQQTGVPRARTAAQGGLPGVHRPGRVRAHPAPDGTSRSPWWRSSHDVLPGGPLRTRCGAVGAVIASASMAVAARCAAVRAGVGAVCSQSTTDSHLFKALLQAMAGGLTPSDALAAVAGGAATSRPAAGRGRRRGRLGQLLGRPGAGRGHGRARRGRRRRGQPARRSRRARGDARRLPGPGECQPGATRSSPRFKLAWPRAARSSRPVGPGWSSPSRCHGRSPTFGSTGMTIRSGGSPGSGGSGSRKRSPTSSAHCARPKWAADARPGVPRPRTASPMTGTCGSVSPSGHPVATQNRRGRPGLARLVRRVHGGRAAGDDCRRDHRELPCDLELAFLMTGLAAWPRGSARHRTRRVAIDRLGPPRPSTPPGDRGLHPSADSDGHVRAHARHVPCLARPDDRRHSPADDRRGLPRSDLLSWVITSYLLASTASTPLWGKAGDLYGVSASSSSRLWFSSSAARCAAPRRTCTN